MRLNGGAARNGIKVFDQRDGYKIGRILVTSEDDDTI
jgi:hypothetical protein